jgi:hypothetical protein
MLFSPPPPLHLHSYADVNEVDTVEGGGVGIVHGVGRVEGGVGIVQDGGRVVQVFDRIGKLSLTLFV